MTTGLETRDMQNLLYQYIYNYQTGVLLEFGSGLYGTFNEKSWNGTDKEPVSREYETYYVQKGGKLYDTANRSKDLQYVQRRRLKPLKRRKIPDHPYHMTYVGRISDWGLYGRYDPYPPHDFMEEGLFSFIGLYGDGYTLDPDKQWGGNDTIALQGKLREKLVGSDFNLGIVIGEHRQTLRLIADTARRFGNAYKAVARGDLVGASRAIGVPYGSSSRRNIGLKDVSDWWLRVQYGVKPLLQDVYGGAQALARALEFPREQTYRVRSRKLGRVVPVSQNIELGNWKGWAYTHSQLIAKIREIDEIKLIGLTDPAAVLWELTPWSFVADWFVPIGSYLSARGLANSLTGTFVTTIVSREFFRSDSQYTADPYQFWYQYPKMEVFKITMDRTVSTTLNVPLPKFKKLMDVASWQHCANAVALLTSRFAGGVKVY